MFVKIVGDKVVAMAPVESKEEIIPDSEGFVEVDKIVAEQYPFLKVVNGAVVVDHEARQAAEAAGKRHKLKAELERIKEDIEQETFGLVRDDFESKKQRAGEIVNELRILEGKQPRPFGKEIL